MIEPSLNENQLILIAKQIDDLLICMNQQSQQSMFAGWIGNLWILKRVLIISGYSLTVAQEQTLFSLCSQGLVKNILKQQVRSCAKLHALMEDILLFFKKNSIDTDMDWESLEKNLLPNKPPAPDNDKKWKNLPRAQKIDNENSHLFYNLDKALLEWYEQQSGALSSHSQASLSLSASLALRLPLEAYEKKVGLHFLLSRHQVLMQYFFVAMADSGSLSAVTEIDWKSFSEQIVTISTPYFQFLSCCNPEMLQANQWQHNKWGNLDHEWKRLFTEMGTQSLVFFECVHTWNQAGKSFANPTEESSSETLTDGEKLLAVAKGIASIRESLNPHNAPPLMDELMVELERLVDLNRDILTLSCYTEPSTLMVDQRWRAQLAEARAPLISALQQEGSDVLNQQGQLSQQIKVLIQTIAADCTAGLGQAPCELVLYLMGSHSREDGTLYSDAEFALVYEPYENKPLAAVYGYLHTWLRLFQLAVVSLGETRREGQPIKPGLYIDIEVARRQWDDYKEDMERIMRSSAELEGEREAGESPFALRKSVPVQEMYNSVMLAFTLAEWKQYFHERYLKNRSDTLSNNEVKAFCARLKDEEFFGLLNAHAVYHYPTTPILMEQFEQQVRAVIALPIESSLCQKIINEELRLDLKGNIRFDQKHIFGLIKSLEALKEAFKGRDENAEKNSYSLKIQYQNPLIFFLQAVKLWCPIRAKTTLGILQEAAQKNFLPLGFVELYRAALATIATLRNRSSLNHGEQNDSTYEQQLTANEKKLLEGFHEGLLIPLQQAWLSILNTLDTNQPHRAISSKIVYDIGWEVLNAFLNQRKQWYETDTEHSCLAILADYPDSSGFTPLGEKKLKRWQQHLISTYLTHERSPYIVTTPGLDESKYYYLPQALGERLFDLETGLPRTDFNNQYASTSRTHYSTDRHAVHLIDDVFFKINAPTEKNLFNQTKHLPSEYEIFGRELAVQAIHYSLGGDSLAPGALWRVEVQAARTCVYWVWLSQACEGEALTTVIKEKPNQLLRLTEMSVSEHFILAFVTAQLDGQPENFMLVLKGDAFKLIGFDNGLAFGQCIKKSGFFSKAVPVLKSAVLLFPQMQSARFDLRTAEKIRLLDVPKWLSTIQAKIDNINQVWARILSPLSSGVAQNRAGIIIRLPEESSVWMSMVLNRFKTRLQREPITLYAKLFSDLNPQLKGLYQTFHEYNNLDEFSRLQFNELDPASYHAYKITTPDGPRIVSLSTVARAQNLREYEAIITNMKATMHLTEQDFVSVNFKLLVDKHNNPDERAQLLQLKLMEGIAFKKLCLAHCTVLTDTLLARILLQMPDVKSLKVLDLRDCPHVSGKGWYNQLKKINPVVKIRPLYVGRQVDDRFKLFDNLLTNEFKDLAYGKDFIEQIKECEVGIDSLDALCFARDLTESEYKIFSGYLPLFAVAFKNERQLLFSNEAPGTLSENPLMWANYIVSSTDYSIKVASTNIKDDYPNIGSVKILVMGTNNASIQNLFNELFRYPRDPRILQPYRGSSFDSFERKTKYLSYKANFWHTSGMERYDSLSRIYFHSAALAIFVFPLDYSDSLEVCRGYQILLNHNASVPNEERCSIILVGTHAGIKSIEPTQIKYLKEKIQAVAYVEFSIETREGIDDLLVAMDSRVLERSLIHPDLRKWWLLKLKDDNNKWLNFIKLSQIFFKYSNQSMINFIKKGNIVSAQYLLDCYREYLITTSHHLNEFLQIANDNLIKYLFEPYVSFIESKVSKARKNTIAESLVLRNKESIIQWFVDKNILNTEDFSLCTVNASSPLKLISSQSNEIPLPITEFSPPSADETILTNLIPFDTDLSIPPQDIITFWLISKNAQASISANGGIYDFFATSNSTDTIDNEVEKTAQIQVLPQLDYSP